MTSRPVHKRAESAYLPGESYEMHTYGDEPIASVANRENGDRMIVEDDTSRNKGATLNDQNDMKRLGKTQELRVGCGALTRSLMYNY
jgi:hypothetical protein